jgi:hypothetical protein
MIGSLGKLPLCNPFGSEETFFEGLVKWTLRVFYPLRSRRQFARSARLLPPNLGSVGKFPWSIFENRSLALEDVLPPRQRHKPSKRLE